MAKRVRLRRAVPGDLAALSRIEQGAFNGDRIDRRGLKRFLASGSADLLVCEQREQLAGYLLLLYRRNSRIARIYSLAVDPAFRGQGISLLLLVEAELAAQMRDCSTIRLEVRCDNPVAQGLYAQAGYLPYDHRNAYYEDGGNALCLQKQLLSAGPGRPVSPRQPYAREPGSRLGP